MTHVYRGDLETDRELASRAGVDDVTRISFHPCASELVLLESTIRLLYLHGIELLLYVFNAEFDARVLEQRVHFYAVESNYAKKRLDVATQKRCTSLLQAWQHGLFVTRALAEDMAPLFQFENVELRLGVTEEEEQQQQQQQEGEDEEGYRIEYRVRAPAADVYAHRQTQQRQG